MSEGHAKLIMVISSDCEPCTEALKKIQGDNRIEVLDVSKDPHARAILDALEITEVPVVLALNMELDKICALSMDKVKCVKYSEVEECAEPRGM